MNEENTADLTTDETLRLILTELRELKATVGGLDARVAALEARSEERSNTTRPLIERAIAEMIQTREMLIERFDGQDARIVERLERVEREVRLFGRKMDIFNEELLELRHGHREVEERVNALEQRPN